MNRPPVARCRDITVDADASTCTAAASINNGSSDPDGDALTISQSPAGSYAQGDTLVTLTVTDGRATATCTATVTVRDTTAPVLAPRPDAITLWPPNHTMRAFRLSDCVTSVADQCSDALDVNAAGRITSISSDELEDARGGGDGNTLGDIAFNGSDFQVRSERLGSSNGRVYTVNYVVRDPSGNTSAGACRVAVPHDESGAPAVDDGPVGYTVR